MQLLIQSLIIVSISRLGSCGPLGLTYTHKYIKGCKQTAGYLLCYIYTGIAYWSCCCYWTKEEAYTASLE